MALLAAALYDGIGTAVSWSSLAAFRMLAESEAYGWPASLFLPNALREIDLPELARALADDGRHVLVLDPLDAERRPLGVAAAAELFDPCPAGPEVAAAPDAADAVRRIEALLYPPS